MELPKKQFVGTNDRSSPGVTGAVLSYGEIDDATDLQIAPKALTVSNLRAEPIRIAFVPYGNSQDSDIAVEIVPAFACGFVVPWVVRRILDTGSYLFGDDGASVMSLRDAVDDNYVIINKVYA